LQHGIRLLGNNKPNQIRQHLFLAHVFILLSSDTSALTQLEQHAPTEYRDVRKMPQTSLTDGWKIPQSTREKRQDQSCQLATTKATQWNLSANF